MDGENIAIDIPVSVNETLGDGISSQNIQDSPNEEITIEGDSENYGMASSSGDSIEAQIPNTDKDSQVSLNVLDDDTSKDEENIPAVTPPTETSLDTYSLHDIYQLLKEQKGIQQETSETMLYGNKLLKISNSIGISIIFAVSLVLGALIGRIVWRKL